MLLLALGQSLHFQMPDNPILPRMSGGMKLRAFLISKENKSHFLFIEITFHMSGKKIKLFFLAPFGLAKEGYLFISGPSRTYQNDAVLLSS